MKAKIRGYRVIITLASGERAPKHESALFFAVKKLLNKQGYDLVKKVPDKDGQMFGAPWYLRDRKGRFCIYDNQYALRDAAERLRGVREIDFWIEGKPCKRTSTKGSSSKARPARAATGSRNTAPSGASARSTST